MNERMKRFYPRLMICLLILGWLDVYSTHLWFSVEKNNPGKFVPEYASETNPLARYLMNRIGPVSTLIVFEILFAGGCLFLLKRSRKWAWNNRVDQSMFYFLCFGICLRGFIVSSNVRWVLVYS